MASGRKSSHATGGAARRIHPSPSGQLPGDKTHIQGARWLPLHRHRCASSERERLENASTALRVITAQRAAGTRFVASDVSVRGARKLTFSHLQDGVSPECHSGFWLRYNAMLGRRHIAALPFSPNSHISK